MKKLFCIALAAMAIAAFMPAATQEAEARHHYRCSKLTAKANGIWKGPTTARAKSRFRRAARQWARKKGGKARYGKIYTACRTGKSWRYQCAAGARVCR